MNMHPTLPRKRKIWTWKTQRKRKQRKNDISTLPPFKKRKLILKEAQLWETGDACMQWLLNPIKIQSFVKSFWSQKPLHIQRNDRFYYQRMGMDINLQTVYEIIGANEQHFTFGANVICKYFNRQSNKEHNCVARGEKVTLEGIRHMFEIGILEKETGITNRATIQLLHPHFYHFEIARVIQSLESYFGNYVSSNIYVTPSPALNIQSQTSVQGLKAHWDDIEAFVLQIRGRKHWKLYQHKQQIMQLPIIESSENIDVMNEDYSLIMECTLNAGDLLYFPRGIIHFAQCIASKEEDKYSLHITISTNQKNTFGDGMKSLMNECFNELIARNIEWRKNMPINIIEFIGNSCNIKTSSNAHDFRLHMSQMWNELKCFLNNEQNMEWMLNRTCDKMAMDFVCNRYPPITVLENSDFMVYGKEIHYQRMAEQTLNLEKKRKKVQWIDEKTNLSVDEERVLKNKIICDESFVRLANAHWMRILTVADMTPNARKREIKQLKEKENNIKDEGANDLLLDTQFADNLLLYSCVTNGQRVHSMAYKTDGQSSVPLMGYNYDAIFFRILRQKYPKWIKVRQLFVECKQWNMDENIQGFTYDRCHDLLYALWSSGLLLSYFQK